MSVKIKSLIRELWIPFVLSVLLLIFHTTTYFLAKFTPFEAVTVGGELDALIPLSPIWVIFYVIWYPLLILTPCYIYIKDKSKFYTYIMVKLILDVVASFIFFFYPTIFNRPDLVVHDFFTWTLNIVYMNDTPAMNCLPSMHCIVCFTAIYVILKSNKILKKCKTVATIIFLLIVLSTLFVKQHAIVDVVAAFILTALVSFLVNKLKLDKKLENRIEKNNN